MSASDDSEDKPVEGITALSGIVVATAAFFGAINLLSGKSNQNESENLYQRATKSFAEGRTNEALGLLVKSIEKNPQNARPHNAIAWIFATNNFELPQALKHANKAVELARNDQENAIFRNTLAEAYARSGKFDEAIAQFLLCLRLSNSVDEMWPEYSISFRLASCYQHKQDFTSALQHIERALHVKPNNPVIYSTTADICLTLEMYGKSVENYKKAIVLSVNWKFDDNFRRFFQSCCFCNMAACSYHNEDYEEAWRLNELAHRSYPFTPHPLVNLASLEARKRPRNLNEFRKFLEEGVHNVDPQDDDLIFFMVTHPNFEPYHEIVLDTLWSNKKISQIRYSQAKSALREGRKNAEKTDAATNIYIYGSVVGALSTGSNAEIRDVIMNANPN